MNWMALSGFSGGSQTRLARPQIDLISAIPCLRVSSRDSTAKPPLTPPNGDTTLWTPKDVWDDSAPGPPEAPTAP
jgi:hypothetical protein